MRKEEAISCLFPPFIVGWENHVTRPTYQTRLQEVQAYKLLDSQEQEAC